VRGASREKLFFARHDFSAMMTGMRLLPFLIVMLFGSSARAEEETAPSESPDAPAEAVAESAPSVVPEPSAPASDDIGILVQPFLSVTGLTLDLNPKTGPTVGLKPNAPSRYGARVAYRDYGFSFSIAGGVDQDESKYGHTDAFDLSIVHAFKVAGRELFVSAFLTSVEGLYAEVGDQREVRSDLYLLVLGATSTLFLNSDCTPSDALIEYRQRPESCGSWALTASIGLNGWGTHDRRSMLPTMAQSNFGSLAQVRTTSTAYFGASGGYTYDWIFWDHYFLNVGLMVGLNASRVAHRMVSDATEGRGSLSGSGHGWLAFGWAGPHFHTGLNVAVDLEGANLGDADATFTRGTGVAFVGMRF
jgi:hypothetical protein